MWVSSNGLLVTDNAKRHPMLTDYLQRETREMTEEQIGHVFDEVKPRVLTYKCHAAGGNVSAIRGSADIHKAG